MALTEIKTSGIADDAVTTDKLANAINTERTGKLANVVEDTSPQLGGALDTNGSNINFGDSTSNGTTVNRLTFGTATNGDLALWHDGNNSYIVDQGTGELRIRGAEVVKIQDSDSAENMGVFNKNGGVELYHNNLKKLDTRADGVAVWGPEGGEAQLRLVADEGDDGADYWRLESNASTNNFNLATYASGAWVDKVTVDSSGNVGIGTTSPDLPLHVEGSNNADLVKAFRITNGGGSAGTTVSMEFECGVDEIATISANNAGSDIGNLMFATARSSTAYPAEAMRIDSDGALLINQTSKQYSDLLFAVTGSNQNLAYLDCAGNGNNYALTIKHGYAYSGSNGIAVRFLNSGGTQAGRIDIGQSTVGYETSSDYRLKENVEAISDGITRLKTLKPYRFNWKEEKGQPKVDGFFAHEVTSAVPEAISGTKDEVDSDKKPVYQGIDQSKLVPLLTAALQEAITKIETLETKVSALEAA